MPDFYELLNLNQAQTRIVLTLHLHSRCSKTGAGKLRPAGRMRHTHLNNTYFESMLKYVERERFAHTRHRRVAFGLVIKS